MPFARSIQRRVSLPATLLAMLVFFFPGCDESLPPRDEPQKFLQASLGVQAGIVRVDIDSNSTYPYPEAITGSNGSLEILLTSFYSEVLQERADVHGTIDVWLESRPEIRTTVTLTFADVDYPVFDPDSMLTLEPGDSVHLEKQWKHIADNGREFFRYVPLHARVDEAGRPCYESGAVRFNAQGSLQVFQNVQPERTPVYAFDLVYRIYVIYPP